MGDVGYLEDSEQVYMVWKDLRVAMKVKKSLVYK